MTTNDATTIRPREVTRFWSKVDRSGGEGACWPWTGARKRSGYGNFFLRYGRRGTKTIFLIAHRAAYIVTHGPISADQVVRHTCDNPPCCNPAHLLLGTQADNIQDAIGRGRWDPRLGAQQVLPSTIARNTARRHLTERDIAAIIIARAAGHTINSVAAEYGLAGSTLQGVFCGTCYKDFPLVRRMAELHRQGIRFSARRRAPAHPVLRALAEEVAALYGL